MTITTPRKSTPASGTISVPYLERKQIAAAVLIAAAKAEGARGLMMKVCGARITVTKPHTDFSMTFEKRPGHQELQLMRGWVTTHETLPSALKFQATASQAAIYKARELGWIV